MRFDSLNRLEYLGAALVIYGIWVLGTFLLEGRIETLLRPGAVTDRIIYTVAANILIGTVLALIILRSGISSGIISGVTSGFQPLLRTLLAAAAGFFLGLFVFVLQHPVTLDPIILLNIYAQVLTVTIAEVAVCWVLVGTAVEGFLAKKGYLAAITCAIVTSGILFGLYHLAHSPPFNQPSMVAFLSVIGLVTGIVFFASRDVYATILFHNSLGCAGVMQSLAASGLMDAYSRPLVPVIGMATVAIAVFILIDALYVRRSTT